MKRRELPQINAGSMADIAFLLLIFFLVTTTMKVDVGILKRLPEKQAFQPEVIMNQRNILEIFINNKNQLLVENKEIQLHELQQIAIDFIDNGGGLDANQKSCDWCAGKQLKTSSDHPNKAFIAVTVDRNANYETYVTMLDQLHGAYTVLRNRLALQKYGVSYTQLMKFYTAEPKHQEIYQKIVFLRKKYPLLISDVAIKNTMVNQ